MPAETLVVRDISDIDASSAKAIFCDLDGCLMSGAHVYDNVATFVAAHADRLWIVSNNSSDTAHTLAARVAACGLRIHPTRILLAGEQAIRRIAKTHPGACVAMYCAAPLSALAQTLGLRVGEKEPDIVLLARDETFNLIGLSQLLRAVHRGARLIVTNVDNIHPGADGQPVPETGAILAAVRACNPAIRFEAIGKPAPYLLEQALRSSGADPLACIFIGDNERTDGGAAEAAGVPFIHLQRLPAGAIRAGAAVPLPAAATEGAL